MVFESLILLTLQNLFNSPKSEHLELEITSAMHRYIDVFQYSRNIEAL